MPPPKLHQLPDLHRHVIWCELPNAKLHQLPDLHRHVIRCELPNAKLYKFDGAVVNRIDPAQPHVPLTIDNLLLRGCTLRKTSWVVSLRLTCGLCRAGAVLLTDYCRVCCACGVET